MKSKMASKPQANPSCATGISFIKFLLDKSDGRLHCSTSSAIEWCENYLNSSKTRVPIKVGVGVGVGVGVHPIKVGVGVGVGAWVETGS